MRRARRKQIVWPGRTSYLLTPDLRGPLEVMFDVLEPGTQTEEDERCMTHEGEEFGFILQGRYEIAVGEKCIILEEGDGSIIFPSRLAHRGRALGGGTVKTLWVITPPSF